MRTPGWIARYTALAATAALALFVALFIVPTPGRVLALASTSTATPRRTSTNSPRDSSSVTPTATETETPTSTDNTPTATPSATSSPTSVNLTISNLAVTSITDHSAAIAWITNEPAYGQVTFSASGTLPQTVVDTHPDGSLLNQTHLVTLSSLSPNTTYTFVVQSTSQQGQIVTTSNSDSESTFTTGPSLPTPTTYQTSFVVLSNSAPVPNALLTFTEQSSGDTTSQTWDGMTNATGAYTLTLPLRSEDLTSYVNGSGGSLSVTANNPGIGSVTSVLPLQGQGSLPATETLTLTSSTATPTATETVEPIQTEIAAPSGTPETITTNNGQITLVIPPGSLLENGTPVPPGTLTTLNLVPQSTSGAEAGVASELTAFQLQLSANGTPITQFASNAPLQVTITYDPVAVAAAGLLPQNLQIYLVDSSGTVTPLPSTVDTVNHTVTASVPHLTSVVLAAPVSVVNIPAVANASTSGW